MLSKTERLAESVIKSVLEILRNHPETGFSELQIEQGTREKIISKQVRPSPSSLPQQSSRLFLTDSATIPRYTLTV